MTARRLVLLHAAEVQRADAKEGTARRCADREPERAEMLRDEAAEHRANAAALADALAAFPEVHIPDGRQLSLLSLGNS